MIMGKTETQAKKLGDLAKFFAEEMKLDIYDDRESGNLFASSINTDMLSALKNYRHATAL
jgi:hypothetical protein